MMFCGLFGSALPALNYFAVHRSSNLSGVTNPAQRRYVMYCSDIIRSQLPPVQHAI